MLFANSFPNAGAPGKQAPFFRKQGHRKTGPYLLAIKSSLAVAFCDLSVPSTPETILGQIGVDDIIAFEAVKTRRVTYIGDHREGGFYQVPLNLGSGFDRDIFHTPIRGRYSFNVTGYATGDVEMEPVVKDDLGQGNQGHQFAHYVRSVSLAKNAFNFHFQLEMEKDDWVAIKFLPNDDNVFYSDDYPLTFSGELISSF